MKIVVIGGEKEPRGVVEERLEWRDGDTRSAEAVAKRVRDASVDVVIVLEGLMPHRTYNLILDASRLSRVKLLYGGRGSKKEIREVLDALKKEPVVTAEDLLKGTGVKARR